MALDARHRLASAGPRYRASFGSLAIVTWATVTRIDIGTRIITVMRGWPVFRWQRQHSLDDFDSVQARDTHLASDSQYSPKSYYRICLQGPKGNLWLTTIPTVDLHARQVAKSYARQLGLGLVEDFSERKAGHLDETLRQHVQKTHELPLVAAPPPLISGHPQTPITSNHRIAAPGPLLHVKYEVRNSEVVFEWRANYLPRILVAVTLSILMVAIVLDLTAWRHAAIMLRLAILIAPLIQLSFLLVRHAAMREKISVSADNLLVIRKWLGKGYYERLETSKIVEVVLCDAKKTDVIYMYERSQKHTAICVEATDCRRVFFGAGLSKGEQIWLRDVLVVLLAGGTSLGAQLRPFSASSSAQSETAPV